MGLVRALLPSRQLPALSRHEASRTRRHPEISGQAKTNADLASGDKEIYHFVEGTLKKLQRQVHAKLSGTEPVEEPEDIYMKGRFRTSRNKGSGEGKKKRRKLNSEDGEGAQGRKKRRKLNSEVDNGRLRKEETYSLGLGLRVVKEGLRVVKRDYEL